MQTKHLSLGQISLALFLTLVAASFLTSCGGSAREELPDNVSQPSNGGGTGNGDGDGVEPGEPFTPAYTYSFVLRGDDDSGTPNDDTYYLSPEVETDSLFRVRIHAAPAQSIPGADTVVMSYGCVQFNVTVQGEQRTTELLRVPGEDNSLCPNAPTSQVLDFSNRTGGASGMDVEISNPRYDFYCHLWWQAYYSAPWGYNPSEWAMYNAGPYGSVCPTRYLHETHTAAGTLEIETNGAAF